MPQGVYLWRVKVCYVGDCLMSGLKYYEDANLTKLFTSKISAMNYATKMQAKKRNGYHYNVKIEKWFGN